MYPAMSGGRGKRLYPRCGGACAACSRRPRDPRVGDVSVPRLCGYSRPRRRGLFRHVRQGGGRDRHGQRPRPARHHVHPAHHPGRPPAQSAESRSGRPPGGGAALRRGDFGRAFGRALLEPRPDGRAVPRRSENSGGNGFDAPAGRLAGGRAHDGGRPGAARRFGPGRSAGGARRRGQHRPFQRPTAT